MRTKILVMLISSFFIFTLYPMNTTFAEMNVKDCLESDADCLDQGEQNEPEPFSNEEVAETGDVQSGSIVINILKIIFALALVLILIYLVLTFLKKKNKFQSGNKALEHLGGMSVGSQKSIQIVRIGNKVYAIGIGNDVTMLDEITDREVIRQFEKNASEEIQPFSFIQNMLVKKDKAKSDEKKSDSFTKTLQDELTKLKSKREQLIEMNKKDDDTHG